MKIAPLPAANYSFDASVKTITFLAAGGIAKPLTLAHILHITNSTQGKLIFQPQDDLTGAYDPTTGVLTLGFDTTSHDDSDQLFIVIDDGSLVQLVSDGALQTKIDIITTALSNLQAELNQKTEPANAQVIDISQNAGNIDGKTMRIVQASDSLGITRLTDIRDRLPSALAGDRLKADLSGQLVTVVGKQTSKSAAITRPSNTTQYAANDVVNAATPDLLSFDNVVSQAGGTGLVLYARHTKNSSTTLNASFRLILYRTTGPTPVADNEPFPLLHSNRLNRIGVIDFFHATGGTGSDSTEAISAVPLNIPFTLAGTSMLATLITLAGYVPTSGEVHTIEITFLPDL